MTEKYKQFWLEKSKEEIINAYGESIHNGEVLLKRIEQAIEYMENIDNHLCINLKNNLGELEGRVFIDEEGQEEILKILRGEVK